MTLTIIPKILTLLGILLWLLPWMLNVIVSYTNETLAWVKYFGS
jgi:flagellar biosynthesis protein FliQ